MNKSLGGIVAWCLMVFLAAGCGRQEAKQLSSAAKDNPTTTAKDDGPAQAVAVFLEAVRTGNDEKASQMLSAVAREKTAKLNRGLTPAASDTAKFSVGKVDRVGQDGARVACTWTDLDAEGQPRTDEAIWVLRREAEGWRVVGVAAIVFPDQPPLVLNFEDPDDMARQQKRIRQEIQRRMSEELGELQAKGQENQEKGVRR